MPDLDLDFVTVYSITDKGRKALDINLEISTGAESRPYQLLGGRGADLDERDSLEALLDGPKTIRELTEVLPDEERIVRLRFRGLESQGFTESSRSYN